MLVPYLSSGGNEQSWFKSYAEQAIKILLAKGVVISTSGSEGGYLSVFKPIADLSPKMEYLIACGNFPTEKRGRYMYNSIEKATRLNVLIFTVGTVTSRGSADTENEEYPGSIFLKSEQRIFSFSGLEPQWDEFISLVTGVFSYYLNRSKHDGCEGLEDIPSLFVRNIHLITATKEEIGIMISTIYELVADEIMLRAK